MIDGIAPDSLEWQAVRRHLLAQEEEYKQRLVSARDKIEIRHIQGRVLQLQDLVAEGDGPPAADE